MWLLPAGRDSGYMRERNWDWGGVTVANRLCWVVVCCYHTSVLPLYNRFLSCVSCPGRLGFHQPSWCNEMGMEDSNVKAGDSPVYGDGIRDVSLGSRTKES